MFQTVTLPPQLQSLTGIQRVQRLEGCDGIVPARSFQFIEIESPNGHRADLLAWSTLAVSRLLSAPVSTECSVTSQFSIAIHNDSRGQVRFS